MAIAFEIEEVDEYPEDPGEDQEMTVTAPYHVLCSLNTAEKQSFHCVSIGEQPPP